MGGQGCPYVKLRHYRFGCKPEALCYNGRADRKGSNMKTWHKVVLIVVLVYVVLCAAAYKVMRQTPERFSRVMMHVPDVAFIVLPFKPLWYQARAGSVRVGDTAPGFSLTTQDQKATVQLASYRGSQPVVLVFGSYT